MAQPTRDEAVATLEDGRHRLVGILARVPEGGYSARGIGGGEWSVKDAVGHLAFWHELALEAIDAWRREDRPRVLQYFVNDADVIHAANAEDVARKSGWDYEEVRQEFDRTHEAVVAAITKMSDEEWRRKAPYPTERHNRLSALLGGILGSDQSPFGHTSAHLPDLEAFVDELNA